MNLMAIYKQIFYYINAFCLLQDVKEEPTSDLESVNGSVAERRETVSED